MNIYTQVRGLWPEAAKLWAAGGGEEAVVRRLREGARGVAACMPRVATAMINFETLMGAGAPAPAAYLT
jgi:hypothetical protein